MSQKLKEEHIYEFIVFIEYVVSMGSMKPRTRHRIIGKLLGTLENTISEVKARLNSAKKAVKTTQTGFFRDKSEIEYVKWGRTLAQIEDVEDEGDG